MPSGPFQWAITILVMAIWLWLAVEHLKSLRSGTIMGVTAGPRAIGRSQRPWPFWVTWFALAIPLVILPILGLLGIGLEFMEVSQ